MSDRRAEIERKKAKLLAIRQEVEQRRLAHEQRDHVAMRDAMSSFNGGGTLECSFPDDALSEQVAADDTNAMPSANDNEPRTASLLSMATLRITDIPPRELVVTYTKQTQTVPQVLTDDIVKNEELKSNETLESKSNVPCKPQQVTEVQLSKPKKATRTMTEAEKKKTVLSKDFQSFLSRTSRIMERALGETIDIFKDYSCGDMPDAIPNRSDSSLTFRRCFYDVVWSADRAVTSLDRCPQHPELIAAGYNTNNKSLLQPDGVCIVWNTAFNTTTPEHVFRCHSEVLSVAFARFHPSLILGGTHSGQIVLWDSRVAKRTPIQRSAILTTTGHVRPVRCLNVAGSENSLSVVSLCSYGRLCSWSVDMLSAPLTTVDIARKHNKQVSATSLAFINDVDIVIGSEDGKVYSSCRYGVEAGVAKTSHEGHASFVTGLSSNPFSRLFLTSSLDWTVKLWSINRFKPLFTFAVASDEVTDVSWSPTNPFAFASVDVTGRVNVWDLRQGADEPVASVVADGAALNRVAWAADGAEVVAGDATGRLWVYDVGEQVARQRQDDSNRFANLMRELENDQDSDWGDRNVEHS